MKAPLIVFSMTSALIACGTSTSSTIAGARSNASQAQANDGASVAPALSDDSTSALTAAYAWLDDGVIRDTPTDAFADDALFADIDVSTPIRSASFGHTTIVRVPAGVVGAPVDPNRAHTFYVAYGRSTNRESGIFGPFVITDNGLGMAQAKVAAVIAAASALEASSFTEPNQICAFPADAQFADIDATPAHRSRSFGHTVTLRVPAGTTCTPTDPDLATTFYVELGDSTNAAGGIYGPFPL